MTLVLTFLIVSFAMFATLLGLSVYLQGFLYQQQADRLPLRALIAAVAISLFITFWTFINTRAGTENKYGIFFQFNPTSTRQVEEFDAVRQYPRANEEVIVPHKRQSGPSSGFIEVEEKKPFKLNDSNYITRAVIITDTGGKKVRFEAEGDPKFQNFVYAASRRFNEVGGSRYIDIDNPGVVYSPSGSAVFGAILLNVLLFVVLFAVSWPVLQYGLGHALVLSAVMGILIMIVLMPLLFERNKPRRPPPPPPAPLTQTAS